MARRRSLASLVGFVVVLLGVIAPLAPLALGPALGALVAELGGQNDHVCACGMKPGTCGCPKCERALLGGDPVASDTSATLRACDDHGHPPLPSVLPVCVIPAGALALAASPTVGVLAPLPPAREAPFDPAPPPTPPPRLDLV